MKKRTIAGLGLLAATAGVLACLPLGIQKDSTLNLLIIVLLYVVLASGWNIVGGYAGQSNLGHAAFFGVGSLVTRLLWVAGWPFAASFAVGAVAAVILALIIGFPAFKLKGVYFAIGTLALAQILNVTVGNVLPEMSYNSAIAEYRLVPRYHLFLALATITVGRLRFL